jgi:hypothetical protein
MKWYHVAGTLVIGYLVYAYFARQLAAYAPPALGTDARPAYDKYSAQGI